MMRWIMQCLTLLALLLIRLYQRWISPYKGYTCAYRVHRGGESCSGYGYRVIGRFGVWRGVGLLQRRFVLCAEAAEACRAHSIEREVAFRRRAEAGDCDPGCDPGCDVGCDSNPLDHCHPGDLAEHCANEIASDVCNSMTCDDCGDGEKKKKPKPMADQSGHCDLPANCDVDLSGCGDALDAVADVADAVMTCSSVSESCKSCGNKKPRHPEGHGPMKYKPLPKKI